MVRKKYLEWLRALPEEIQEDYAGLYNAAQRIKSSQIDGYRSNDHMTFNEFIVAGIPLSVITHNQVWVELYRANPKNLDEVEKIFNKHKNQPKIELVW